MSGKFLCVSPQITLKSSQNIGVESFRTVWKVSGWFGKFPDSLESFRSVWKVSVQSGKFPDSLESFRTVWTVYGQFTDSLKISGKSGKFSDSLESFQTVWKISGQSGKFTDSLKVSRQSEKNSLLMSHVKICRETKAIYALLMYIAKTNYALLTQITHF